jgi:hypothetical protein
MDASSLRTHRFKAQLSKFSGIISIKERKMKNPAYFLYISYCTPFLHSPVKIIRDEQLSDP